MYACNYLEDDVGSMYIPTCICVYAYMHVFMQLQNITYDVATWAYIHTHILDIRWLNGHTYINTCIHAYMHACMHTHILDMKWLPGYPPSAGWGKAPWFPSVCTYICMCICMYARMNFACMRVIIWRVSWKHVRTYVCMQFSMYVCMYACCMYACNYLESDVGSMYVPMYVCCMYACNLLESDVGSMDVPMYECCMYACNLLESDVGSPRPYCEPFELERHIHVTHIHAYIHMNDSHSAWPLLRALGT
jgi:hypothetical protein